MKHLNDFVRPLSDFLNNYLPNEKGVSANTITAENIPAWKGNSELMEMLKNLAK
jgi:hypothetical protein